MDWKLTLCRLLGSNRKQKNVTLLLKRFCELRQPSTMPARFLHEQLIVNQSNGSNSGGLSDSVDEGIYVTASTEPLASIDTSERKNRMPRYKELTAKYGFENDTGGSLRPNPKLRSEMSAENAQEILLETMIPLRKVPYDDQLAFKHARTKILVRNLTKRLKPTIVKSQLTDEDLICEVAPTQPSPAILGFRNKSEFACGADITGAKKTIGYNVGRVRLNESVVVPPTGLVNAPDSHQAVAESFQQFCRMSPLGACVWGENLSVGYWRGITVRSNRAGDTMAIVSIHPQKLSQAELSQQRHQVKSYFIDGPGAALGLRSLYFQACPHTRCSHYTAPYIHLAGDLYIFEQLGTKKFRISPGSFYQLNPGGAEVLYETIRDLLQPDGSGCLLDVCCGTGAIGIYMADSFKRIIGCDLEPLAIDDAIHNARVLNKLENSEFYHQPAEKAVPALLHGFQYEETDAEKQFSRVSAVVNPSRNGLEWSVIKALRQCTAIDDVVYVSCKPLGNAMRNIADLAQPKSEKHPGEPFELKKVVPVDMFPNTEHCELVFYYRRKQSQATL